MLAAQTQENRFMIFFDKSNTRVFFASRHGQRHACIVRNIIRTYSGAGDYEQTQGAKKAGRNVRPAWHSVTITGNTFFL